MDEKKRIIEFDAAESVPVDGQMAIDSPQLGTKKITPTLLLKDINDLLGDTPLETISQTVTGAVNEVNGKAYKTVSLTQQEYDDLPDTKLTDNIAYYITDGTSTIGNALWTKVGLHGLDTTAQNCSDAINELKGTLTTLFKTKNFSHSYTISANSETHWNPVSGDGIGLSGYTAIGIVRYNTNNYNVVPLNVSIDDGSYGMMLGNTSNSSQSASFSYTVLYVKS